MKGGTEPWEIGEVRVLIDVSINRKPHSRSGWFESCTTNLTVLDLSNFSKKRSSCSWLVKKTGSVSSTIAMLTRSCGILKRSAASRARSAQVGSLVNLVTLLQVKAFCHLILSNGSHGVEGVAKCNKPHKNRKLKTRAVIQWVRPRQSRTPST